MTVEASQLQSSFVSRWKATVCSLLDAMLTDEENEVRLRRFHMVGALGLLGHPLYYFIWSVVFPQSYESGWLRAICTLLFLPFLFIRRLSHTYWYAVYPFVAITIGLPFSFTFLYLQNAGAMVWAESLLIAVVILFHFSTAFALGSLVMGAVGAAVLFELGGGSLAALPLHTMLIQLPILVFEIATLIIIKLDRQALTEQKQRGATFVLGVVAHELRTPLASVQLTMKGVLARVQRCLAADHPAELEELPKAVERVRFEVARMNNTIELLVVNSKNPKSVEISVFDPHKVICSTIAIYPFETGVSDHVHIAPSAGFHVKGNPALFGHVITNLTKNAIEAIHRAGKGEITIVCRSVDDVVEVLFRDTGSGVPAVVLKRMFQPFFSYPAHRGTGVGLAFCRKVLRSWGGTISCESVEHEYTKFSIRLPRHDGAGTSAPLSNVAEPASAIV